MQEQQKLNINYSWLQREWSLAVVDTPTVYKELLTLSIESILWKYAVINVLVWILDRSPVTEIEV